MTSIAGWCMASGAKGTGRWRRNGLELHCGVSSKCQTVIDSVLIAWEEDLLIKGWNREYTHSRVQRKVMPLPLHPPRKDGESSRTDHQMVHWKLPCPCKKAHVPPPLPPTSLLIRSHIRENHTHRMLLPNVIDKWIELPKQVLKSNIYFLYCYRYV